MPTAPDTVAALVFACVGVASIWLVRYSVTLTPAGVVVLAILGRCEVLWPQLLPGRLAPTTRLRYQPPGSRPKVFCLSLAFLQADRAFLATVLRHYAEQPRHRSAIGTPAELDRLSAGFAAWSAQCAAHPAAVK